MSDDDEDSDADGQTVPDFGMLQEGLSTETLAALLQFLPHRKFDEGGENEDCDDVDEERERDGEERDGEDGVLKTSVGNLPHSLHPKAIKDSTVCVAYTANDVNVITETFKRLQEKNKELEMKNALAAERRVLLNLDATSSDASELSISGTLVRDGVIRINSVLIPDICDRLRSSVNEHLKRDMASCVEQTQAGGYGNVLCREHRWDLYQHNDSTTNEALTHMLGSSSSSLSLLFKDLFSNNVNSVFSPFDGSAQFHELSVLVSDPGAASQPIHPDSTYTPFAPMYTVFVALQDIEESMGPTIFLPKTNTEDCHKKHKNGSTKDSFLSTCEYRRALLRRGDAVVMDSRTLHCGDANLSARRMLLYFTIRNPLYFHTCDPPIPVGSKWAGLELNLLDLIRKDEV